MNMPSFLEQSYKFAVSQEAQLLWIVLCGVLSFCRVYISTPSLFEVSVLRTSISSAYFRESSYCIMGLSLTYSLDLILDLIYNFMSGDRLMRRGGMNTERNYDEAIMTGYEKVVFLFGIVVVPLVALVPIRNSRCCTSVLPMLNLPCYLDLLRRCAVGITVNISPRVL